MARRGKQIPSSLGIRKEDPPPDRANRFKNKTVMSSRSFRIIILFLLVLTFSPFDMGNDYCYMFQFEMAASLDSEISGMSGKYRGDSHHHCICLLCIATARYMNVSVFSMLEVAEELDPVSLIPFASLFPIEFFRPPRT